MPESPPISYRLCPHCMRATPSAAEERYCPNDGTAMLSACPACGAPILSPYGSYCVRCGHRLQEGGTLEGEPH